MAGSLLPVEEASLVKHVQELAVEGHVHVPPPRYIRRDGKDGPADATVLSSIPIIDLCLLSSPSSSKEREDEMEKLRSALTSWGLFQAIGHQIPSSLLDKVRNVAKEFFDLPMKQKQKYSIDDNCTLDFLQGYGNDLVLSEDQVLDWSDRLYLLVNPQNQRKLQFWPENPNAFRETLHEYSKKTSLVGEFIFKIIAKLVGLEEKYFLDRVGEQAPAFARFNYYPPCSRPDLVYGVRPHSDGGTITIVLPDKEVEGLQVLNNGQWIKVPIIPHALVVNIADQIEIMSNGMFKSPVHRVVTNSEKERISLAMFYMQESEKEIEPAAGLINESRPRLFRKIKVKDYSEIFIQYSMQGKRPIDWAKV